MHISRKTILVRACHSLRRPRACCGATPSSANILNLFIMCSNSRIKVARAAGINTVVKGHPLNGGTDVVVRERRRPALGGLSGAHSRVDDAACGSGVKLNGGRDGGAHCKGDEEGREKGSGVHVGDSCQNRGYELMFQGRADCEIVKSKLEHRKTKPFIHSMVVWAKAYKRGFLSHED